ncbi:methylated-DNA--protein-cysteine methyltransferase [Gadus macrocephalus]|uniref:methylated-DNA--protein-cysteine methyltransferase n=1 Tax=Gadus macrocephalus TaxID=80720 RepID=UPI0028CB4B79|nr:methylated-DNA--protein-cysteine methyltransferase [Gadus macrocephalus]
MGPVRLPFGLGSPCSPADVSATHTCSGPRAASPGPTPGNRRHDVTHLFGWRLRPLPTELGPLGVASFCLFPLFLSLSSPPSFSTPLTFPLSPPLFFSLPVSPSFFLYLTLSPSIFLSLSLSLFLPPSLSSPPSLSLALSPFLLHYLSLPLFFSLSLPLPLSLSFSLSLSPLLLLYFSRPDSFSSRVLRTLLQEVRFGETVSYKRLAEMAGNPRAVRAVGGAMRRNPVPLVIPCHRVVPSSGPSGAYMGGRGNHLKVWLLAHERPGG